MIILDNKIIQHIPKTAGTSLKETIRQHKIPVNYMGIHVPLNYLNNPAFSYAKNYEKIAVVRTPVSWYNSWINYHRPRKRSCSLTQALLYNQDDNLQLSGADFLHNALNLTKFFKDNPQKLEFVKQHVLTDPRGHSKNFLGNISELTPEYFQDQGLYEFYIKRQLDDSFTIFTMESQLKEFLNHIGVPELISSNVTRYIEKLPGYIEVAINEKYNWFYKKYYQGCRAD